MQAAYAHKQTPSQYLVPLGNSVIYKNELFNVCWKNVVIILLLNDSIFYFIRQESTISLSWCRSMLPNSCALIVEHI